MLHVTTGLNILYATLSERESVASSVYVLKLTPTEAKKNFKNIRVTDLTSVGDRVNKLAMTVVATPAEEDFPLGKVHLIGGDYIYEFFNEFGVSLEKGMLRFNTTVDQTNYNGNNVQEKVYDGN